MSKWDSRFLDLAKLVSSWSKDPSTKVGAVLVGSDKEILSVGYNGFPRGIADTPDRLNDRPTKYELVVHAEINSIMNAVRNGINTKGATMYMLATKVVDGKVWGGAPCIRCSVETIQSGVSKIVVPRPTYMPDSWKDSCNKGAEILKEAGVELIEVDYE